MKYQSDKLNLPLVSGANPFSIFNLTLESQVLKKNPLKDTNIRSNFVLVPRQDKRVPVIFHLSGYFGNGYHSFNYKTLEENFPQMIARLTAAKKIPMALHVFVDAMTSIGGSQFINSEGCGRYSDYIQKELTNAVMNEFSVQEGSKHWAVMGSSSGGYGALHHVSQKDSPFGIAIAIAPDSYFESSLLPELYNMARYLAAYKNVVQLKRALTLKEIQKQKNSFHIFNALAMSLCYGKVKRGEIEFPINLETGLLNSRVWKSWKQKDPVVFLQKNRQYLKNKQICLDVGSYDEFSLYFGTRQIRDVLKKNRINCTYSEFEGGHFGLSARKELALQWLSRKWKN